HMYYYLSFNVPDRHKLYTLSLHDALPILNTVGGDVEAGLALSEMIAPMSKPTVSIVLGGGHSIGCPIAVAADYSFIASTATMTIDRKSTRLNSSHVSISYAVFCLKKNTDI